MSADKEYYPMPFFPILSAKDIKFSTQWYQEALGFQKIFEMPAPDGTPVLVHLRWAKYADLLLIAGINKKEERVDEKGKGITLNFQVFQGGVDELAKMARDYGAVMLSAPHNTPWNTREFSVADPDGFHLTFTQGPVRNDLDIDDVIRNIEPLGN